MRHSQDDSAEIASTVSKVPILNAGSGKKEHPSQSLLDIFTIREKKGKIDGLKIAILGDLVYGRTIHSLLEILTLYKNIEVWGLSKECFKLPEKYKELLSKNNINIVLVVAVSLFTNLHFIKTKSPHSYSVLPHPRC